MQERLEKSQEELIDMQVSQKSICYMILEHLHVGGFPWFGVEDTELQSGWWSEETWQIHVC